MRKKKAKKRRGRNHHLSRSLCRWWLPLDRILTLCCNNKNIIYKGLWVTWPRSGTLRTSTRWLTQHIKRRNRGFSMNMANQMLKIATARANHRQPRTIKKRRPHNHKESTWKIRIEKWLQTSATTKLHMQLLKEKKKGDGCWKKLATSLRSTSTKNMRNKVKKTKHSSISRKWSNKKMSPLIKAWWIGMSYKYSKNRKRRWRSCCKRIKKSIRICKARIWRHWDSFRWLKELIQHRRANRSGSSAQI